MERVSPCDGNHCKELVVDASRGDGPITTAARCGKRKVTVQSDGEDDTVSSREARMEREERKSHTRCGIVAGQPSKEGALAA